MAGRQLHRPCALGMAPTSGKRGTSHVACKGLRKTDLAEVAINFEGILGKVKTTEAMQRRSLRKMSFSCCLVLQELFVLAAL